MLRFLHQRCYHRRRIRLQHNIHGATYGLELIAGRSGSFLVSTIHWAHKKILQRNCMSRLSSLICMVRKCQAFAFCIYIWNKTFLIRYCIFQHFSLNQIVLLHAFIPQNQLLPDAWWQKMFKFKLVYKDFLTWLLVGPLLCSCRPNQKPGLIFLVNPHGP